MNMTASKGRLEKKRDDEDDDENDSQARVFTRKPLQQYYRPEGGSTDAAQSLLERDGLTEQDVLDFCHGNPLRPSGLEDEESEKLRHALVEAYHERRYEISELARKLWTGEAIVDDDGRLVPVVDPSLNNHPEGPENQNGNNNLPHNANNNANNNNNNNNGEAANNNNGGILNWNPIPQQQQPFPMDHEEEERRWLEQEERAAAEAIARAVKRYRQEGIPEDDFVLVAVAPAERTERANLTFRRICFAVLAVATAFICIMLQTLPLFPRDSDPHPIFDPLLYELLSVRSLEDHVPACGPGLHRTAPAPYNMVWQWINRLNYYRHKNVVDCSDGVLHIPSKTVLVDSYLESSTNEEFSVWEPFLFGLGVNASWFMPCRPPVNTTLPSSCQSHPDSCAPGGTQDQGEPDEELGRCFRGIHDNMISSGEVYEALGMGAQLIQEGGDHFDIHYNMTMLTRRLPTVLDTIRGLLRDTYSVQGQGLNPVAFRVNAVGPMDGTGVHLHSYYSYADDSLLPVLNRTNYIQWIDDCKHHNELTKYSLPWPSSSNKPVRDPCQLMSDLEADPRFAIHTTIFLSTGGADYRGGVSLYVDDHKSNQNPRRKIRRGVAVDGSRGRIVVSTGGLENRRCRFPLREGIRASLQIWWNCNGGGEDECGI